ncbi:MAG: hypothetical protein ABIE68_01375 [bacterium]
MPINPFSGNRGGGAIRPGQPIQGGSFGNSDNKKKDDIDKEPGSVIGSTQVMPGLGSAPQSQPEKKTARSFNFGQFGHKDKKDDQPNFKPKAAFNLPKKEIPTSPPVKPQEPSSPKKSSGLGKTLLTILIIVALLAGFVYLWFDLSSLKNNLDIDSIKELNKVTAELRDNIESLTTSAELDNRIDQLEGDMDNVKEALGDTSEDSLASVIALLKQYDTDGDGLNDYEEQVTYRTDINNKDTDGDGYEDGVEVDNGYNPNGEGRLDEGTEENNTEENEDTDAATAARTAYENFMDYRRQQKQTETENLMTVAALEAISDNDSLYGPGNGVTFAEYEITSAVGESKTKAKFIAKEYLSNASDAEDYELHETTLEKINGSWLVTNYNEEAIEKTTQSESAVVQEQTSKFMNARMVSNRATALEFLTDAAKNKYQFSDILLGQSDPHYESYRIMKIENSGNNKYTINIEISEASNGTVTRTFEETLSVELVSSEWLVSAISGNIYDAS